MDNNHHQACSFVWRGIVMNIGLLLNFFNYWASNSTPGLSMEMGFIYSTFGGCGLPPTTEGQEQYLVSATVRGKHRTRKTTQGSPSK